MPSNKITYTFVAIDEFSKVANKIAKSIKEIEKNVNSSVNKTAASTSKVTKEIIDKTSKSQNSLNKLFSKFNGNIQKSGNSLVGFGKKLGSQVSPSGNMTKFSEKLNKISDFFGMGAYYRFMNIGLPMFLLAKSGESYASALENSNIQMDILFKNTKKYGEYRKLIDKDISKYSNVSRFNEADILKAISVAAQMTGNIKIAQGLIKPAIQYAVATGQTKDLSAAMSKLIEDAMSGSAKEINLQVIPRVIGSQRLEYLKKYINQRYSGIIAKDFNTFTGQSQKLGGALEKIAGVIDMALTPALMSLNKFLDKITPKVSNFIQKHKELIKVIGILSILAIGWVIALMAVGAAIGVVAFVLTTFSTALTVATVAFKLLSFAFKMSPIGLIITLITTLSTALYALYKNSKKVREELEKLGSVITKVAVESKDFVVSHYHSIMSNGEGWLKKGESAIMSPIQGLEHLLKVDVNVNDKNNTLSSVQVKNSQHVSPNVKLGGNLTHT